MSEHVQEQPATTQNPNGEDSAQDSGSLVDKKSRAPLLMGLVFAIVAIGALFFLYQTFIGSRSVSTDNAYVSGESAAVTPLTSGKVIEVYVTDTQPVKRGQILFRLEDADQRIAVAQAEAQLEVTKRTYGQARANTNALGAAADASATQIASAQARIASAQAALTKAQTDYSRRAALAGSGAVSAEELTTAREALQSAQASAREAEAGLASARSSATSARKQEDAARAIAPDVNTERAPQVLLAKAELESAKLALARTVIRAPIDGVVSRRAIQVGQKIDNGQVAMTIVPIGQLYVDANFKEDQLGKVRSGQSATLTSDFYGDDVVFHGKVVGFSGGTGAAFSLIPAQNATGNWIKVVQRLPVRIELDRRELQEHPLRIGLSMDAKIDLKSKD